MGKAHVSNVHPHESNIMQKLRYFANVILKCPKRSEHSCSFIYRFTT